MEALGLDHQQQQQQQQQEDAAGLLDEALPGVVVADVAVPNWTACLPSQRGQQPPHNRHQAVR